MYLESEYAELKKKFRAEWGYFIELCKKGANLPNLIWKKKKFFGVWCIILGNLKLKLTAKKKFFPSLFLILHEKKIVCPIQREKNFFLIFH